MHTYKFCLLLLFILAGAAVSAQSPAGISSGLRLWIKADAAGTLSTTGGLVDSWTYANDNTKSFTATGTDRPTLTASSLNFLPSLVFGGAQMMDGPTGANAPITAGDDDYCLFVVWRSTFAGAYQRVWGQRHLGPSDSGDGFCLATWNDGHYGDQIEKYPYAYCIPRDYTSGAWNISQLNLLNQALNDLEIADDRNLATGIQVLNSDPANYDGPAMRTIVDAVNRLGARDNNSEETLTGNIAELIIYDRPISGAERNKIFSYLAVKYGIVLQTDLLSSAGTTIWDATANATYNNAVFGIGKDNNAGLLPTQSNSLVTGSGDGTGQSGAANITLFNTANFSDQEFIVIGNDNGSTAETGSGLPSTATASARRLGRLWKGQHTGGSGLMNLSIDLSGITTTGVIGNTAQFRLMIDADGDGNFTTGTPVFYSPSGFTGSKVNFTGVALSNSAVFTLVTLASFTGNQPPTACSITGPANNAQYAANGNVTFSATGADPDNNLSKIEFYEGTTKLGEATSAPYIFTWNNVQAGTYNIIAKAVDAGGLSINSTAITVVIQAVAGWSLSGNPGTTPGSHFIGTTDGQRLVLKSNNIEGMTIDPSGNVGIGTPNPAYKLDVGGDARFINGTYLSGPTYFQSPLNYVSVGFSDMNTPNAQVNFPGDGSIGISTGQSAPTLRLTVLDNGNVGIGTNTPQSTLAVNGEIAAKKVRVTPNGWPDYVFSGHYRLPSLAEVEQYIRLHRHLPAVISAAEVTKEGVDLGNNQKVLLQKIEELTLYIIEQNKRIESLEKKVEQLTLHKKTR